MTSSNLSEALPTAANPRGEVGDRGRDRRSRRDSQPGGTPARDSAEPVVPLASAGVSGRADGDRSGGVGGAGFAVPLAAGPYPRVAAVAGQEDDGSGDPQGGSRGLRGLKKTLVAVAVVAEGRFPMKTICDALGLRPICSP